MARNEDFLAFLDARPVFKGHVLVVPLQHTDDLLTLPEAQLGPFFSLVRQVAGAMEKGLGAQGSFVADEWRTAANNGPRSGPGSGASPRRPRRGAAQPGARTRPARS